MLLACDCSACVSGSFVAYGDTHSPCPRRCARVVSWLEHLAAEAMKRQGRAAFAQGEGLWRETRTEMRSGTSE